MYIEQIRAAYKTHGYQFYENGNMNLNIGAIRNTPPGLITDIYDDDYFAVYKKLGQWYYKSWPVTTKPGNYFLTNPMNPLGCAIICPGQYPGVYKMGAYDYSYGGVALVQSGIFKVDYLDKNGNISKAGVIVGPSGLMTHCVAEDSPVVGRDSAGCQDFWDQADYVEFWALVTAAVLAWGNSLTYTLFNRSEVK